MRNLHLVEYVEHTGVSGNRIVAEGTHFSTSAIAVHWTRGPRPVTAIFPNLDSMIAFHGDSTTTTVHWLDPEPEPDPDPEPPHPRELRDAAASLGTPWDNADD